MPFQQTQTMPPGSNPLRRWLASQPLSVTQTTMAQKIGVDRSTLSRIMQDGTTAMPSLKLAAAIEKLTDGGVRAADLFDYIQKHREAA